jgi:hypothetical protein
MKIMVLMNEYTDEQFQRRKRVVEASTSKGVEIGYSVIEGSGGGASVTDLHRAMVAPAAGRPPRRPATMRLSPGARSTSASRRAGISSTSRSSGRAASLPPSPRLSASASP